MATLAYPADPFAALGLTRDASPRAIRARYYQLARRYHPNTNHGVDNSPTSTTQTPRRHYHHHDHSRHHHDSALSALTGHFNRIYDAYKVLSKDSERKRYIEWAALEELDTAVEAHRLDLEYIDYGDSGSDGWSSDLDDFDVANYHRSTRSRSPGDDTTTTSSHRRRTPGMIDGGSSPSLSDADMRGRGSNRRRSSALPERMQPQEHQRGESAQRAAAERRKRLNRIKRKEIEVFEAYRDAKLRELQAQIEAERLKDVYERTRAKREKIEKIPLESSTRVRMVRNIFKAMKLLRPEPRLIPQNRRLSLHTSILSDDFVSISSPLSARPGVPMHRRGFSSDISGDQTDSDEETPHPHFRHPFRSPTPSGRPSASRERSPAPRAAPQPPQQHVQPSVPTLTHPTPPLMQDALGITFDIPHHHTGQDHPKHLADPKFRLFVKRPTGLDEHDLIQDLTSPISPSPIINHCRELIHLPPGFAFEEPANTSSGENGTAQHQFYDSDSDTSPVRQDMLVVKVIGEQRFREHIPGDHVHKLNISEESRLLGKRLDIDTDPHDLLRQLQVWDPYLATRFMVKPDIKASFAFRLICSNREFVRQTHQSFIALSYRRKNMVKRHYDNYSLPLSKEMMQAVWEERISDEEGLWVDQICIDQDDDRERDISMSAMDLVYRGARLIVVVLDDFEFEPHEVEVLSSHMEEYDRMKHVSAHRRFRRHSPPWLDSHDELCQVISKILSASWFRRAWCRHEMRLAKDHIFLIPCRSVGTFRKTILRMSSSCLAHLLALATEVPFSPTIEILKPALHAFFRDRTEVSGSKDKRPHHGNFTTVAAEVFRMEAGGDPRLPQEQREADARWDRMSIILNAMECGLALRPSADGQRQSLSTADCYYSLLMLALAARDPGALCSAGKPLTLTSPSTKDIPSWLFEPTVVDAGLNNYKTLNRLPLDSPLRTGISRGAHWVQLDLKFFEEVPHTRHRTAEDNPEILQLAQDFVTKCEANRWGRHRRRYLLHDQKANDNFGSMKEVYVQTLAGVFSCGPDWMASICQRYGVSRWKQDLQPAYWLVVSLRNMNGKWPTLLRDDWTVRAASFLMDFVNFLVIRGMPQRQLKRPEVWRPVWIVTRNRGKVLTFTPDKEGIYRVIPSVLLDADYRDLARLWIVEPRTTPDKWTLLGKSVLFGDDQAKLEINIEDEMVRHQQKVYGRSVNA